MSVLNHCKHGTFVGGCGVDWMCHACEMGDADPTPHELRTWLNEDLATLETFVVWLEDLAARAPAFLRDIPEITRRERHAVQSRREQLEESLRWAIHEHDGDWLNRRYAAWVREEREARVA